MTLRKVGAKNDVDSSHVFTAYFHVLNSSSSFMYALFWMRSGSDARSTSKASSIPPDVLDQLERRLEFLEQTSRTIFTEVKEIKKVLAQYR